MHDVLPSAVRGIPGGVALQTILTAASTRRSAWVVSADAYRPGGV